MEELKTNYKDDVLEDSMDGMRRYIKVENDDETISLYDATSYKQAGDYYGADDLNRTNAAINELMNTPKTVAISKEKNNGILEKEDGIFVDDKTKNIDEIEKHIQSIKKYQRYINTELDSCYCQLRDDMYVPITNEIMPFEKISGNMEVENGTIKVKAGERVEIILSVGYGNTEMKAANISYNIKDITNNIIIGKFSPYRGSFNYEFAYSSSYQYTNEAENDCYVAIVPEIISQADTLVKNYTHLTVFEIGRDIVIDPIEHVNTTKGIEDTPIGHIISYMGNNPPKHYLGCDGSVYNISDYPYLSEHIKTEFGSYNYFGGDGITTFGVPDLKGEFLRGSGTASRNTGTGEAVGQHQDATKLANIGTYATSNDGWIGGMGDNVLLNPANPRTDADSVGGNSYGIFLGTSNRSATYQGKPVWFTARPTNTSVLYCIKYEPTYYVQFKRKDRYSTDETIIGEWIDGKPIYRKIIPANSILSGDSEMQIKTGINNIEYAINIYGWMLGSDGDVIKLPYTTTNNMNVQIYIRKNIIFIRQESSTYQRKILWVAVEYTKTTD